MTDKGFAFCAIGLAFMVFACWVLKSLVPEGYEDASGFHYGKPLKTPCPKCGKLIEGSGACPKCHS